MVHNWEYCTASISVQQATRVTTDLRFQVFSTPTFSLFHSNTWFIHYPFSHRVYTVAGHVVFWRLCVCVRVCMCAHACMCASEPLSQSNGFVQPSVAVVLLVNDPPNPSELPITHTRARKHTDTNTHMHRHMHKNLEYLLWIAAKWKWSETRRDSWCLRLILIPSSRQNPSSRSSMCDHFRVQIPLLEPGSNQSWVRNPWIFSRDSKRKRVRAAAVEYQPQVLRRPTESVFPQVLWWLTGLSDNEIKATILTFMCVLVLTWRFCLNIVKYLRHNWTCSRATKSHFHVSRLWLSTTWTRTAPTFLLHRNIVICQRALPLCRSKHSIKNGFRYFKQSLTAWVAWWFSDRLQTLILSKQNQLQEN